jgi:hypothetical protein
MSTGALTNETPDQIFHRQNDLLNWIETSEYRIGLNHAVVFGDAFAVFNTLAFPLRNPSRQEGTAKLRLDRDFQYPFNFEGDLNRGKWSMKTLSQVSL